MLLLGEQDFAASGHNSFDAKNLVMVALRQATSFVSFVGAPPGSFQRIKVGEHPLRAKVFPHCPKRASYALYRKNNIGNYECRTCGLLDIPEEVARRLQ